MNTNQVVVRYLNGSVSKGRTSDFSPNKKAFHLEMLEGQVIDIDLDQLKAIFFVKDYKGDKNHINYYGDTINGAGRIIKVTFFDGESITGYTQGYSPDRLGFFMSPAETNGNNDRIFVVKSSTVKVEFCSELCDKKEAATTT